MSIVKSKEGMNTLFCPASYLVLIAYQYNFDVYSAAKLTIATIGIVVVTMLR